MTASIPDGMSFSDLEALLEDAPSDITNAPERDDDDEDTRSDMQKLADHFMSLAYEQVEDPMVHKLMIMRGLSNMITWHTHMGESFFKDGEPERGTGWMRDAGKFQACMDILMSIKISNDDDCVNIS